jgi:hypothetical protein
MAIGGEDMSCHRSSPDPEEDRGATGSSEAPGRQGSESMQPVVSVG